MNVVIWDEVTWDEVTSVSMAKKSRLRFTSEQIQKSRPGRFSTTLRYRPCPCCYGEMNARQVKVTEDVAFQLTDTSPSPDKAQRLVFRLIRDNCLTSLNLAVALYAAAGITALA